MEGQELAARHITLREQAGLTQEQEAKMAGVSPTTISGIESGKITRPHLKTLLKITRALGTDLEVLRESGKAEAPTSPEQPSFNGLLEEERREPKVETGAANLKGTIALDVGEGVLLIGEKSRKRITEKALEKLFQRTERREISAREAMDEVREKAETT